MSLCGQAHFLLVILNGFRQRRLPVTEPGEVIAGKFLNPELRRHKPEHLVADTDFIPR
jgi:hypothetical protein